MSTLTESQDPTTNPPHLDTQADTSSSSLSPLERRNSLEKHLQTRPEEKDLKDRHILLDTNAAPALQARQVELERQRVGDSLKKSLANRPTAPSLIERNILPDSKAAPALQGQQKELEKRLRADSLEKALQGRPEKEVLIKEGILREGASGRWSGVEEVVEGRVELE